MLVHFWETKDTSTGARAPIVGRLRFRATRSRVIAGTPDEEVLPEPFSVRLDDDGKASVPLAATSGSWAWEVSLYGDAGWGPFYVAVGAGAEADWPDLVRVDPATLAPAQPAVPAWEAAVSAVEGYAQAAAEAVDQVGEVIAAEVQGWLDANPPTAGDDGREVEFGLSATHVQWRYVGDVAWTDLIALSSLVGATGATPELQVTATHLQWRAPGGTWADLVALADLRGPQGDPGREVELQTTATHVQWRLVGGTWADLVTLEELKGGPGPEGPSGQAGSYVGVKTVAGTAYEITLSDIGWLIRFTSADPVTITLPSDTIAAIMVGKTVDCAQRGAGSLTFVAGAGASPLIVADTAVTRKLGSMATAIKEGANLWSVVGDLA